MTPNPALRHSRRAFDSRFSTAVAILAAAILSACGGGGGAGTSASISSIASVEEPTKSILSASADVEASRFNASRPGGGEEGNPNPDVPRNRAEALRFLTQATFGPSESDISRLMKLGYSRWVNDQLALPATSHRAYWEAANAALMAQTVPASAGQDQVWESFWKQASTGPDQLRQRVAFALSQIFVISAVDANVGDQPRALAAWLDMLGDKGLGTYRDLLETVSLHPLMGLYLTSLHNQKADAATGRVPDENYAREVMQLFTIGLVKLNLDGTPVLVGGRAVETYTPADISGLARVFTGWSWECSVSNSNCFYNGSTGGVSDPDRAFKPMKAYPQYHSTEAKTFLGTTIAAQATANPAASLKVALDTLNAHPNTAPFISRQLIQRLVTSNPSPAYVSAVAQVFLDNGAGVQGDLKAVVKAILVHPDAKLVNNVQGKVREPVLRLSAYLHAFPHTSVTGGWKVGNTDSATTALGQTPLRAGSVFNFYRPGYAAPGTSSAAAGLVAPEMQVLNESTASGWVNYMRDNITSGVGQFQGTINGVVINKRDLQRDWTAEMNLADSPTDLAANIAGRLLSVPPTPALLTELVQAVSTISIPVLNASGSNLAAVNTAKRNRVNAAVLLTLASPDFIVQK